MDATKLMALMGEKKAAMAKRDKTVKPKDGKNRIVLLPGWEAGNEHVYFHDFGQHYIKNINGDIQAVYPCADKTYGHQCAVCDALAAATRMAPDDKTIEMVGEAKANGRVLINALVRDSDKPNDPVIYEMPRTLFGAIVNLVEEWGIAAFQREIIIDRSGKGLSTKYTAQIGPAEVKVDPSIIAKINNLSEYVKQESAEQQQRALSAIGSLVGSTIGLSAPSGAAIPHTPENSLADLPTGGAVGGATPADNAPNINDDLDSLLASEGL